MIKKITFVGAGSMAEAIISGILNKELCTPDQIHVTNKNNQERLNEVIKTHGIQGNTDKAVAINGADLVILAVKPKDVQDAIHDVRDYISEEQLVVSVIAGVSSEFISRELDKAAPVVRAMPNTSATVSQSATAIAAGNRATSKHLKLVKEVFETVGRVTVVDEKDLHAVTGLSGSGPAYIYYLVEAMEEAALLSGLPEDVAKDLVKQTLIGATEMLKTSKDAPAILRRKITSEGGTTQAGLEVLDQYDFQAALIACIKRATERSVELGEYFTVTAE